VGAGRHAQANILDLIGDVYDAALDEKLWCGLAPRIAQTFKSTSAQIHVRHTRDSHVERLTFSENYRATDPEIYNSYYAQRDVWVERAAKLGLSKVFASKDLISDAEFEQTEIYQGLARHIGIFYVVGSVFPIGNDGLGVIGMHRPRDGATYDEQDKTRVRQFLPHLKRALQIRSRLADPAIEHGAALDALKRSGTATLAVTRDGHLLYANDSAEQLLRACDAIRVIGGRLAAADRAAAQRLTAFIRECSDLAAGKAGGSGGTLAISRGERLPLTALVAPFRPAREALGAPLPAAIVFLRDPESPSPKSLALRGLFGLTAAEAVVAAALADGKVVEGLATELGVTLNTVRTHLKNVFAKTGTTRQAQLVALILSSVAVLLGG